MNKRSEKVLEFNKILLRLQDFAATPAAKKKISRMHPLTDPERISLLQEETRAAFVRLSKYGNVSFSGVYDISPMLLSLKIGQPLSQSELLRIASLLTAAKDAGAYGILPDEEADILSERFYMLQPLENVSSEIKRCIISDDTMSDDASPNLKRIRRELDLADTRLHSKLEKLIRSEELRTMLQDSIVTQRNGRYCIPVRAEYKNRINGMVHDQSRGGATVFIEPIEIVEFNNRLRELESEESAEIEKILSDLSSLASGYADEIKTDYDILTDLDFIFAKGKYASSINASEPVFNNDGIIDMHRAVHPLLDPDTAVPIDIRLGDEYSLLIVTGPNTGGKTVSLKTLGLLQMMGQAGLHIPAADGSRLTVFRDIFADIGDEQSIEQNLSTFSSHMSNTVYIVDHADEKSLCLFDEPGGGTDPTEGAAIAMALLSHLKERGARVMATTHYSELKTYALTEPGAINASFDFDIDTMTPTYKLIIGVPGRSNAFEISEKLGLSPEIISSARENVDGNALAMENAITDLEHLRKEAEIDKAEIEEYKSELMRLKESASDRESKLSRDRDRLLSQARDEAREILEDAKKTADQAIRDYNKWLSNPSSASPKEMEKRRALLREKASSMNNKKSGGPKPASSSKPEDFHIGDLVKSISMDAEGTVERLPDPKGMVKVSMGILTSLIHYTDLIILKDRGGYSVNGVPQKASGNARSAGSYSFGKGQSFRPEINLLGKTVDEAISALDKYIDDALLANADSVRVVHGKGTGALRKGVHRYLKQHPSVKSFELAEYGEGDAGVTIVRF